MFASLRCLLLVAVSIFVVVFSTNSVEDLSQCRSGDCEVEGGGASLMQRKSGVVRTSPTQEENQQVAAWLAAQHASPPQKDAAVVSASGPMHVSASQLAQAPSSQEDARPPAVALMASQPAQSDADKTQVSDTEKAHDTANAEKAHVTDRPEDDCQIGRGCLLDGVRSERAVCVASASVHQDGSVHNECWDFCNVAHAPEDYHTGNIMLDVHLAETVISIRSDQDAEFSCHDGGSNDDQVEQIALQAPMDDMGYKTVATLKSHAGMEAYIRRMVANAGCRVADEAELEGVVPFYSGEKGVQTYAALEAEIFRACTGTGMWLTTLYPHQEKATPFGVTLGSTAPITEQGFQDVVALKDALQMLKYARRVVSMLHGWVVDESGLHGILPFFSGEKSVQTLGALILEVETAMAEEDGWVMKNPASVSTIDELTGEELIPATPLDDADLEKLSAARLKQRKGSAVSFKECPDDDIEELTMLNQTAWTVPLDDQGYEALVQLKSDCAMMQYAVRVVKESHCHLLDESGLKGMVPYYSGTHGVQDLTELRTEIMGACAMEGKWVVPDVKYWSQQTEDGVTPTDAALIETAPTVVAIKEDPWKTNGSQPISLMGQGKTSHKSKRSWACKALNVFCP